MKTFKSLVQFIKEGLNSLNILNLIVKYQVEPEKIVCKAPVNYTEDKVIQYLQDLWFAQLPGGQENIEKIFGKNSDHLIDTYLEYDRFSHSKHEMKGDKLIDWNSKMDPDNDHELEYFLISNVKYCLSFESFELKVNPGDDIEQIVEDIFKSYESNAMNEYPIEIKLIEDSIEYKNDNL